MGGLNYAIKKVKIKDYSGLTDIEVFIQNSLMYIVSDNNVGKKENFKISNYELVNRD